MCILSLTEGSVPILSFNVLLAFFIASLMNLNQMKLGWSPGPPTGWYCGFFFRSESLSPYTTWLAAISDTDALLAEWGKGGVVTVDTGGHIRLWETGLAHLQRSLTEWRNMIGQGDGHMQVPPPPVDLASYWCAFGSRCHSHESF